VTSPTADPERLAAARRRLAEAGVEVLGEDHHILGISKSAGVLSQPGPPGIPSLVEMVDAYRRAAEAKPGRAYVGLVHRLDRNVSGAMVLGKTSKAASRLSAAFRSREGVEKLYLAWTAGVPPSERGTLRTALVRDVVRRVTRAIPAEEAEGDPDDLAVLDYEVEARTDRAARLLVRLRTGQTHQIRAQLAREGLPLFGDVKYGGPAAPAGARCDRPALHARRLVVPHPVGGAPVAIEAPLPEDLLRLDRVLGLHPPAV
jgi:23S rRNA pseudouridine1911/1915/1917 synthase